MSRAVASSPSVADFAAIEGALLETARGRWFLQEYARRERQADTAGLLHAIGRLENVVRGESVASVDRLRYGLIDMAKAIDRTKAEIAAIKPKVEHGRIEEATEELDFVMQATESATSDILAAGEMVQETAQSLRREGAPGALCDALDAQATDIFMACSFQDLTGQRTRKVIQLLRFLEARIDAMIAVWGEVGEPADTGCNADGAPGQVLLNGPSRPGEGLEQADIDRVMSGVTKSHAESGRADDAGPLSPLNAMSHEEQVALFT
jgi:chemotaxis regulatin CheY-phosphate phosphatase CheZ